MAQVIESSKKSKDPKTTPKWVYLFNEGDGQNKTLLGGKGAGLCEMTRAGLPVPPGLIVTTEACNAFFENDKSFPEGMWDQVKEGLQKIEEKVGKKFGDPQNPLLVSVRSGAAFTCQSTTHSSKLLCQIFAREQPLYIDESAGPCQQPTSHRGSGVEHVVDDGLYVLYCTRQFADDSEGDQRHRHQDS